MVITIDSTLPARLGDRWNLENRENAVVRRVTDAKLMECALSLRPKLWYETLVLDFSLR